MIPGARHLSALLHASGTREAGGALLGPIGWLLPRPHADADGAMRLSSYRALNGSGGLYVPDLAYDMLADALLEVDYLCSSWFGRTSWMRLLWREWPETIQTGARPAATAHHVTAP